MNGTIITVVGELDVEEECIMLDSQDWFTSDVPTLIATLVIMQPKRLFFSFFLEAHFDLKLHSLALLLPAGSAATKVHIII